MDKVKQTALFETFKTVAFLTVCSLVFPAMFYILPTGFIVGMFLTGCLFLVVRMIYEAKLSQAQFEASQEKK